MDVLCHIDRPLENQTLYLHHPLEIAGWAFFNDQAARYVEVHLDGELWQTQRLTHPRADVKDHYPATRDFPSPLGFCFSADLPPEISAGTHTLDLFFLNSNHQRSSATRRTLHVIQPAAAPSPVSSPADIVSSSGAFTKVKKRKLQNLRPLIKPGCPFTETPSHFNFLNPEAIRQYQIDPTDNVSAHNYDEIAKGIIQQHRDGLILDCGAGKRAEYFPHVINFEIADFPSTDVIGVAEDLPFQDNAFDVVLSLNVFEHLKDPFRAAREIARVLKPGGELYCVAAFLQPFHGYPHHFYNMTFLGLQNLFHQDLKITRQFVSTGGLPIFTLTWFLNEWISGLPEHIRNDLLRLRVSDLTGDPITFLEQPFVKELGENTVQKLAATNSLLAIKPK